MGEAATQTIRRWGYVNRPDSERDRSQCFAGLRSGRHPEPVPRPAPHLLLRVAQASLTLPGNPRAEGTGQLLPRASTTSPASHRMSPRNPDPELTNSGQGRESRQHISTAFVAGMGSELVRTAEMAGGCELGPGVIVAAKEVSLPPRHHPQPYTPQFRRRT
jgi:hypothetical protein